MSIGVKLLKNVRYFKASGDKLKKLEVELKEREKLEAKAAASEKSAKENIAAEERKKKQLEKVN